MTMPLVESWAIDGMRGAEGTAAWVDVVSETHLPWHLDAEPGFRAAYSARVERRRLGDLSLVDCWCDPCRGERGPGELVTTPGDYIGILTIKSGSERVTQTDREVVLGAGDVVAWDSVREARFVVTEPLHKRTLLVPRARFAQLLPRPELAAMRKLEASPALRLYTAYLDFIRHVELEEPAAVAAGNAALELLGAVLGSVVAPTRSAIREGQRAQVRAYIESRLGDPDLRPVGHRGRERDVGAGALRAVRRGRRHRLRPSPAPSPGAGV